jgi:hypothetical protein
MRVLVLGGYGAVGARVVAGLRSGGDVAVSAGRDPARADLVVDVSAGPGEAFRAALDNVDVVVNACGAEDPDLVVAAAQRSVAFVDITGTFCRTRIKSGWSPPRTVTSTRCTPSANCAVRARRGPKKYQPSPAMTATAATSTTMSSVITADSSPHPFAVTCPIVLPNTRQG